jgi:hypothetical protein
MSESRIKEALESEIQHLNQRKKVSDILLKDAKNLFSEVICFNNKTPLDEKLEEYRNKYHFDQMKSSPPLNPKTSLYQVLLFSKVSAKMGNQEAKNLFKKAKAYQNDQAAIEEGYILVQTPTEIEAKFDAHKNEAVTALKERQHKKTEEKSEAVAARLHANINFIHNWYPDPDVCTESPALMSSPIREDTGIVMMRRGKGMI